jgi:hypothetical protein
MFGSAIVEMREMAIHQAYTQSLHPPRRNRIAEEAGEVNLIG